VISYTDIAPQIFLQ